MTSIAPSLLAFAFLIALPFGARAQTPQERGAYLVQTIAACGNCHASRDDQGRPIPGRELAGGLQIDLPIGATIAPNITPDPETGIGRWSDAEIALAIREGKRPGGGVVIGPPMPIEFYRQISDRDLAAIVAYLRSVPPVRNVVAKSQYKIPLPTAYGPPVGSVPEPSREDKVAYGAYLAGPLGHCMECHTPMTEGRRDMTRLGAGGFVLPAIGQPGAVVVSSNLTPHPRDGLAGWSDQGIKTAITTGVRPDGRPLTPIMAFPWYAGMTGADLDAIVAYLRSLKPLPTP